MIFQLGPDGFLDFGLCLEIFFNFGTNWSNFKIFRNFSKNGSNFKIFKNSAPVGRISNFFKILKKNQSNFKISKISVKLQIFQNCCKKSIKFQNFPKISAVICHNINSQKRKIVFQDHKPHLVQIGINLRHLL